MKKTQTNNISIIKDPVWSLLFKMTFPMIFGMLGLVIFNIADTYYVTKLGLDQMAAMTFTFPIVMIVGAIAQGIGLGASALISKAQGESNRNKVTRYSTDSLILGILVVVFFAFLGMLTIRPLFTLLGADDTVMPYILEYMQVWYPGVVFLVIPMIGNSALRSVGDTKKPAMIMSVSAVMNIVLDPILIFGIGPVPALGIRGAAIATVIARAFTLIVSLYVLAFRFKIVSLKNVKIKEIFISFKELLYIGLPNAITRVMTPLAVAVVTGLVATFGKEATAGFGIAAKIEPFALIITNAMVSIFVPLLGQNLGAGKHDRVQEIVKKSNIFSLLYGLLIMILFMISGHFIAGLFSDIPEVIDTVSHYLLIVSISYGLQGLFLVYTSTLNVLNKPVLSAVFSLARLFVLYVPMALFLSGIWGLNGIWIALDISFLLVVILLGIVVKKHLKR